MGKSTILGPCSSSQSVRLKLFSNLCRLSPPRNLAYANALCAQQNFEGAVDAATAATAGFKVSCWGWPKISGIKNLDSTIKTYQNNCICLVYLSKKGISESTCWIANIKDFDLIGNTLWKSDVTIRNPFFLKENIYNCTIFCH